MSGVTGLRVTLAIDCAAPALVPGFGAPSFLEDSSAEVAFR